MSTSRTRRALLSLYPSRWRRRYEDEVLGHLDDECGEGRLPARIVVDVVANAAVERSLGAYAVAGGGAPSDATRGLRLILWGWCCCVVGGVGFAKLAEHFATARYLPLGVPGGLRVASTSYDAVQWVALLGGVLVALLVVPAALVALAHGGPAARRRLIVAAALAVVLTAVSAAWLAWLVAWAHQLTFAQRNGGDARYGLSVVGLALVSAAALASWTRVATAALRAVTPADGSRISLAARAAALCAVILAAAAAFWLAAVSIDAPGFLGPVFGAHAAGLSAQWPYVLAPEVLLAVGAALAVVGARAVRPCADRAAVVPAAG